MVEYINDSTAGHVQNLSCLEYALLIGQNNITLDVDTCNASSNFRTSKNITFASDGL